MTIYVLDDIYLSQLVKVVKIIVPIWEREIVPISERWILSGFFSCACPLSVNEGAFEAP